MNKTKLNRCFALILSMMIIFGIVDTAVFATDYPGVYQWKLAKNNGSYEETILLDNGIGPVPFVFSETQDFDDQNYEAFAADMAESIKTEFTFTIYMWSHQDGNLSPTIDIVDATCGELKQAKDKDGTNRWCLMFHLILDPQHNVSNWTYGAADVNLQVLGNEAPADPNAPVDYTGITNWRLVFKGTSDVAVFATGNESNSERVYPLPNIIEGDAPDFEAYADVLLKMYDLQISTDWNNYNITVPIIGFSHQGDGTYLVEVNGTLTFTPNSSVGRKPVTPYVSVRTQNDDPIVRNDIHFSLWNLAGNSGDNANFDQMLGIRGVDYVTEVAGREAEFADDLLDRFHFLKAYDYNNWYCSQILSITFEYKKEEMFKTTAVYQVTVFDPFNGINKFEIFVDGPGDSGNLDGVTVPSKDPDGIRMNLFDYYINDADDETGNPWDDNWQDFDGGINAGHALKFFNMGYANGEDYDDRDNQIGLWNHSTQSRQWNMKHIVQATLSARYPKLALNRDLTDYTNYERSYNYRDSALESNMNQTQTRIHTGTGWAPGEDFNAVRTESLAYLFDPTVKVPGKTSYANVNGLFQRDSNGYYYYDSKSNFAEYDKYYNKFILYNDWGVATSSPGASADGQFFPFNTAGDVFSAASEPDENGQRTLTQYTWENGGKNSRSYDYNHFFGFTMEIDFQQPLNGIVGDTGEDMVFRFAGDDDVWIFIDGVLVLDLGGVHSAVYGEINFATGQIITGLANPSTDQVTSMQGKAWSDDTTLKDIFEAAGVRGYGMEQDITEWNGDTFNSDTLHTIQVFYLERGHYDSNLALYYNLQARVPHKIYKVDEDGAPLAGATFSIYAAAESGVFKSGETYHGEDEFVPANQDGTVLDWGDENLEPLNAGLVTGKDGYVTLSGIDFAHRAELGKIYYFLEETSPAPGYRVLPERLVLEYLPDDDNPLRGVFRVLNQYETGAYASFSAILEDNDLDNKMYYALATLDPASGQMSITKALDENGQGQEITGGHQSSAMLFAVPMIYTNIGNGTKWYPIYGSNTDGFNAVDIYSDGDYYTHRDNQSGYTSDTDAGKQAALRWALRHNLLAAAMRQAADAVAPDWHFKYETITRPTEDGGVEEIKSRFSAELLNLPGDKERYLKYNGEIDVNAADLQLVGLLVDAESMVMLINEFGGSTTVDEFKALTDEEKYLLLQNTLRSNSFADKWDQSYYSGQSWSTVRDTLDKAYEENTEDTTRSRGVNLAHINEFTRYYGSVLYIPNERRELRVLKQDAEGNALEGADFALYDSFDDAVHDNGRLAEGTTGENGILIFSCEEDISPANERSNWAEMNWDEYADANKDSTVWLAEIEAPKGFIKNKSIVQIFVGERTIYANASAYEPDDKGNPVLIDDLTEVTDLKSAAGKDGVEVWASVGKLFQSMEKYADSLLNSTLLDIDGTPYLFMPSAVTDDPDKADWGDPIDDTVRLHFWDRRVLGYTSSDYSTAHKRQNSETVGGEAFSVTQNGYLQIHPTQTPTDAFMAAHDSDVGMSDSRRDNLFYNTDDTPISLYNIFSPVNIVVIQNELEGNLLTITDGGHYDAEDCGEENETFLYKVTGTTTSGEEIELTVTVHGGGSASIVVPPGHYTVEEQHDWSWRYENEKTVGDRLEEEWTIWDNLITSEVEIESLQKREVIYYHKLGDKKWLGGESYMDNRFAGSANSNEEQESDPRRQQVVLTAVNADEKKKRLSKAGDAERS